jgi:hypothetical protein
VRALAAKVFFLIAPFALVLGFVEYRLRHIPNSYSRAKSELEARLPNVEVVTVGSSHAAYGFDANSLALPAYNLAHTSQSLYYDAKLIETYAPLAPHLKLVIFALSYFSFESRLDRSIESWRCDFYRQVYSIEAEGGDHGMGLTDRSYIAMYTPKTAYAIVLRDLLHPGSDADLDADTGVKKPAEGGDSVTRGDVSDAFGAQRVRFHEGWMSRAVAPENIRVVEAACDALNTRGVTVAFVSTPVYRSYFDHMNPDIYARMQADANEVARACRASYSNYMHDSRFAADDFVNSDHLNKAGARKFSRIVSDDVLRKLFPSSPTPPEPER